MVAHIPKPQTIEDDSSCAFVNWETGLGPPHWSPVAAMIIIIILHLFLIHDELSIFRLSIHLFHNDTLRANV